jgi:hypothetical protein
MPVAALTRVHDPARLLERAVEGLFPLAAATAEHPWPSLSAWLVLRQGGLRDDLYRLAATRGVAGWFDPTICLFTELRAQWGAPTPARALTEQERHAILARLLDEKGRACFGRGAVTDTWVPVVDSFLGELVGEDIAPAHFTDAMHRIAADDYDTRRAECLGGIYAAWHETLARTGRSDGRDAKVRLAQEIVAQPEAFADRLGGRREIRIVGLADLRGGWRHLVRALATSPALDRLEILTSATLPLPSELPFSTEEVPGVPTPAVTLLEAPDVAREAELVAVRVRDLIEVQGATPSRIAIVARQARPAVDTIAGMLAQVGVPVTARRRAALVETAPARALMTILTAAREAWGRHSVAELAEHPLLTTSLDAGIVNLVGYSRAISSRAGWREALDDLLQRAEARELEVDEPESRRAPLPSVAAVRDTIAAWDALAPRLAPLDESRSLVSWCGWARDVLHDQAWGIAAAVARPLDDATIARNDVRAREAITAIIDEWLGALQSFGAPSATMDAGRFLDRLTLMLAQDLVTPPSTDFGVVVAEALAAGWRAFDHVFVVGMSAGEFPQRPSGGQLVDAQERQALIHAGLPLDAPDAWRDRERELFGVLSAAAGRTLTLSWPAMDAEGREVARSAFVDEAAAGLALAHGISATEGESLDDTLRQRELFHRVDPQDVLTVGFPVALDASALAHARVVAKREGSRGPEATAWNGWIEHEALRASLATRYAESYQWSATQLEQAAKCRWHWFAARQLGLETLGDAEDQLEPTVSGSIRHDALNRFFARAALEHGAPVQLMTADEQWAIEGISHALDEAWEAASSAGLWLGPQVLRPVARAELLRELVAYVRFEIGYNEDGVQRPRTNAAKIIRSGAIQGEHPFADVQLEGGEVRFRLRGSIDRIDEGLDGRVEGASRYLAAIDYKSSKYSTPAAGRAKGWDDGIVLQVPLYAAALEKLRPGHIVARMEYRTLRDPQVVHQLCLHAVKGGEIVEAPEARARLDAALVDTGELIANIRDGVLPADPARSSGCPPYCPALDICRIPGGPREPA